MITQQKQFMGPSSTPKGLWNQVIAHYGSRDLQTIPGKGPPSFVDAELTLNELEIKIMKAPLPPYDLIKAVLDHFFDEYNIFWPMLHRPSFERALQTGLQHRDPAFRSLREWLLVGSRHGPNAERTTAALSLRLARDRISGHE